METAATDRLKKVLETLPEVPPGSDIRALTPDASTREYFRIEWDRSTAIACVYPQDELGAAQFGACLDVTGLFLSNSLPVAAVLYSNEADGVIIHEDFGDTILRDVLLGSERAVRESYIDGAIALIARIQSATDSARQRNSVASRLSFDYEKLSWELDFFRQHYFTTLRGRAPESVPVEFVAELNVVARELAGMATVLTHRDFHAANLMLSDGELKIIDHQDARIGSTSYDLVSLLLDRVTEAPSAEWLAGKRRLLLAERESLGLASIDENEFAAEFRLQTIQRCLKAIGTFSFQSANRGKKHFEQYIGPMFDIVLRAAGKIGSYPAIEKVISRELGR